MGLLDMNWQLGKDKNSKPLTLISVRIRLFFNYFKDRLATLMGRYFNLKLSQSRPPATITL